MARHILLEARELFAEVVAAGLIGSNPAVSLKPLPVQIRRQRMRYLSCSPTLCATIKFILFIQVFVGLSERGDL